MRMEDDMFTSLLDSNESWRSSTTRRDLGGLCGHPDAPEASPMSPISSLVLCCGGTVAMSTTRSQDDSIFQPLKAGICTTQYKTKMSQQKVSTLITLTWLLPVVSILVLISLSAPLRLCGNVIDRIYCGNYSVVKLACSDTRVNNIYGLVYTVVSVILPLVPILFSYMRILKVCFSGSKPTRQKAVSTCSPHLVSLLNFSFGCCFQILLSRLEGGRMPPMLGIVLSLYFLTCQPLFTPLLYGLNVSSIRLACGRLLVGSLPL
ncbi:olfactory receptor 52N4-like isoform 3-T4 [Spinachia spinachia]